MFLFQMAATYTSISESKPMTFTIEQTELIRRLRNSGITKEQIIAAFESFDKIDQDLGSIYNVPSLQTITNQRHGNGGTTSVAQG